MKQFFTKCVTPIVLRNTFVFSTLATILISWCSSSLTRAQATGPYGTNPVTIEGHGRALEDVLSKVQMAFRFPIYYEELPLENASDLQVVSVPGVKRGLVSPVSELTVTLTKLDSTPYLATQTVLGAYVQAGYPGSYKVVPHDHRVDVVPAQIRAPNGFKRDIMPILTIPISFPLAKRTAADTVQLILNAASKQSGYPVLIVRAPTPHFESVELGANGETVGDVLENLSTALSTVYSFAFRYVPDEKTYYFDVAGVASPDPQGKPAVHEGKRTPPMHGPDSSPFFVKNK
jgi:hypothetical protein